MGKQNSKLKPEVLEDLKQNTEFSGKKLKNFLHVTHLISTFFLSLIRRWNSRMV